MLKETHILTPIHRDISSSDVYLSKYNKYKILFGPPKKVAMIRTNANMLGHMIRKRDLHLYSAETKMATHMRLWTSQAVVPA